jgi:hypothetical protein
MAARAAGSSLDQPSVRTAVAAYAARRGLRLADERARLVVRGPFATGLSSGGVQLVNVPLADGALLPLLWKHTSRREAIALRALTELRANPAAFPELIAAGVDDRGDWVLFPRYEGRHPRTRHQAPGEVFDALAALHHHWEGRTAQLEGLIVIDPAWWKHLCIEYAMPRLVQISGSAVVARAVDAVEATAQDARIDQALGVLPRTLVHGDMHEANMVIGTAGVTIIDWGEARLGAAMLDVANIADHGSAREARYVRERERLSGQPVDRRLVEIGYWWAQAQITTQYLPYVAERRPEAELDAMLVARERAFERLGSALLGAEDHA